MAMAQIKKEVEPIIKKPAISSVSVNKDGILVYPTPVWKKIAHHMLKDFPIVCWYISVVMVLIFIISVWSIAHRHIATTHHSEVAIYWFLIIYSLAVVGGMIGLSYFFSRNEVFNSK